MAEIRGERIDNFALMIHKQPNRPIDPLASPSGRW